MVRHGDEIGTTSNKCAMDFSHVSKYCSCLSAHLEGFDLPTVATTNFMFGLARRALFIKLRILLTNPLSSL